MSDEWKPFALNLLNGLQTVMEDDGGKELDRFMAGWMDYTILSFTQATEVKSCRQLEEYEKEYLIKLLQSGKSCVWAAVDLWPGEHDA